MAKNPPASAGDRFNLWVRKIPWRRKWQSTLVFLPGKSCGQRNWWATVHRVVKESDDLVT